MYVEEIVCIVIIIFLCAAAGDLAELATCFSKQTVLPLLVNCHCLRPASQSELLCHCWSIASRPSIQLLKANCSAIAGPLPLLATSFSKQTALPLLVHCLEVIYSASQSKLFCHCWSIAIAGDQLLKANCSAIAGPLPDRKSVV